MQKLTPKECLKRLDATIADNSLLRLERDHDKQIIQRLEKLAKEFSLDLEIANERVMQLMKRCEDLSQANIECKHSLDIANKRVQKVIDAARTMHNSVHQFGEADKVVTAFLKAETLLD